MANIWNEDEICNKISNEIHDHFREENHGDDSPVFVDEVIEDGVIALNWHVYNDCYVTTDYVSRVAEFVFANFSKVNIIMSPCKDFERKN